VDFLDLPIPEPVARGIDAVGFKSCTPIQEKVLPLTLAGQDVAGQSQTGTGKTAAFLVTIFSRLLRSEPPEAGNRCAPRALVVAPTRELVVQIRHDAEALGFFTGLRFHAVFGGVDYQKQREALRAGCDLLIGTPGRLIDYFKQRVYTLRRVEVLVIDEADRMFDMGFVADLRFLLRRLPRYDQRQSMLFSATLSWDVMELAYEHMNEPVKVSVTPGQLTAENAEHLLFHVGAHEKFPFLLGLLKREVPERTLIFVNMKREAERLGRRLADNGYDAEALTGDVDQRVRLKIMKRFKAGELPILVATDVASRGLHVEGVSHVINYDLPLDPEDYVHRIGRTARAGASGKAITLACEAYVEGLAAVERLIGFKIPVEHVEDEMIVQPAAGTSAGRGRRRKRGANERKHPDAGRDGVSRRRRRSGSRRSTSRADTTAE